MEIAKNQGCYLMQKIIVEGLFNPDIFGEFMERLQQTLKLNQINVAKFSSQGKYFEIETIPLASDTSVITEVAIIDAVKAAALQVFHKQISETFPAADGITISQMIHYCFPILNMATSPDRFTYHLCFLP